MQKLNDAVVKESRIELGEWFILVDLGMSQVKVAHRTDGRNWVFYSIEEALEVVA